MTRYWSGTCAAALIAGSAVLAAQSNQSPATSPPADSNSRPGTQRSEPAPTAQRTNPSTERAANIVTLTGCIQNAPSLSAHADAGANTGSTPRNNPDRGTAQTGSANQTAAYVLADASMSGTTNPSTSAGVRNRGTVGTSGSSTTYQLEGDVAKVAANVGHQVRVSGLLQSSNAAAAGAANAASNSTAAGPTLRVQSITVLGERCENSSAPPSLNNDTRPGDTPQTSPRDTAPPSDAPAPRDDNSQPQSTEPRDQK